MDVLTANSLPTKTIAADLRMDCVRIVADDLTGACDSAAAFAATRCGVRVWLGPGATVESDEPVQAFNTDSRGLDAQAAAESVIRAAGAISGQGRTLWFKKVDSAGRGPIAAELLAAHRALGTRAILFAPSFPAAGRTVVEGVLRIEDAAGSRAVDLMEVFAGEFVRVDHVGNAWEIPEAIAGGATVLVCDASTEHELEELAAVEKPGLLYAGSAGLAKALAAVRFAGSSTEAERVPRGLRAMTVCGTPHRATQVQMSHLAAAVPGHARLHVRAEAGNAETILAEFRRYDPEALILTGGDTALLALAALGAHSIVLRGEVAAGIPWGEIQGGVADGRVVITKSGGFGVADSLTRIVRELTGESAE